MNMDEKFCCVEFSLLRSSGFQLMLMIWQGKVVHCGEGKKKVNL